MIQCNMSFLALSIAPSPFPCLPFPPSLSLPFITLTLPVLFTIPFTACFLSCNTRWQQGFLIAPRVASHSECSKTLTSITLRGCIGRHLDLAWAGDWTLHRQAFDSCIGKFLLPAQVGIWLLHKHAAGSFLGSCYRALWVLLGSSAWKHKIHFINVAGLIFSSSRCLQHLGRLWQ